MAYFQLETVQECISANHGHGLGVLVVSDILQDISLHLTHSFTADIITGVELLDEGGNMLINVPTALLLPESSVITGKWTGQSASVLQAVSDNRATVVLKTQTCPDGAAHGRVIMPRCPDYTGMDIQLTDVSHLMDSVYAMMSHDTPQDRTAAQMVGIFRLITNSMTAVMRTKIFVLPFAGM